MPQIRKHERHKKAQLGQFFTPSSLAEKIVNGIDLQPGMKVLDPGCGAGSFVSALKKRNCLVDICAVEIDHQICDLFLNSHSLCYVNLICGDFLLHDFKDRKFDLILGNPPFGGTIDLEHQNELEKQYGRRGQWKIKKESYSFFIVKSLDLLKEGGQICFICSDSLLTIRTMSGLRQYLMSQGSVEIERLDSFSDETNYPMVLFKFRKGKPNDHLLLDGMKVHLEDIEKTGNFSWTIFSEDVYYFHGSKLGDYMVCSSGLTTGKNEWFIREIDKERIVEQFSFEFYDDPISLRRELERARLNKLSSKTIGRIIKDEEQRKTRRNVRILPRVSDWFIKLPHPDYRYYNKASNGLFYEEPKYAIYWKDDGDAVRTFKKNGNWYLHGMGGEPFYGREGVTWPLISSRLRMRYLPQGYIFDSGAPSGFLRDGVAKDELYFILGWCNTNLATQLLKKYINHTKNIQSKDVERLPYPFWVPQMRKEECIRFTKELIKKAHSAPIKVDSPAMEHLEELYMYSKLFFADEISRFKQSS